MSQVKRTDGIERTARKFDWIIVLHLDTFGFFFAFTVPLGGLYCFRHTNNTIVQHGTLMQLRAFGSGKKIANLLKFFFESNNSCNQKVSYLMTCTSPLVATDTYSIGTDSGKFDILKFVCAFERFDFYQVSSINGSVHSERSHTVCRR